MDKYEITVGIECHVQLATKSKLFSGADNDARDKEPNSVISSIDYALPGMLPVLNKEAVALTVRAAKALNAEVAHESRFDRKHYFYPDLPKGYQITQMYQPLILSGHVDVPMEDGSAVKVGIHHAHLEEDAGKLTHHGGYSLVDLNRAGTPLIEIVSLPDIHSAAAAKAYAAELHRLMVYAGVTNGDLYHGNMRFDVNVSIAPKGSDKLGIRTETKNLNSFRSIERAVEYETKRHAELLERGDEVKQETRGWDDAKQITISQRSKEEAQDYRYMPEPDIPPVMLTVEEISAIQADMPKLPPYYRSVWQEAGFNKEIIDALLLSRSSAELVERIRTKSDSDIARRVGFWFVKSVTQNIDENVEVQTNSLPIPDDFYIVLAEMVNKGDLNSNAGDTIFTEMMKTSEDPRVIAERLNLIQDSDESAIAAIVDDVLKDPTSRKALEDVRAGNDKAIGYLVGQVMKLSNGKANPGLAQKLIRERL